MAGKIFGFLKGKPQKALQQQNSERALAARQRNQALRAQNARAEAAKRVFYAQGNRAPGITSAQQHPLNSQGYAKAQRGFSQRTNWQPRA